MRSGRSAGKLVGPSRRRRAVDMLQERLGISQRRGCRIVGQHRSTQRHAPQLTEPDRYLRARLRRFAVVTVTTPWESGISRRVSLETRPHHQ